MNIKDTNISLIASSGPHPQPRASLSRLSQQRHPHSCCTCLSGAAPFPPNPPLSLVSFHHMLAFNDNLTLFSRQTLRGILVYIIPGKKNMGVDMATIQMICSVSRVDDVFSVCSLPFSQLSWLISYRLLSHRALLRDSRLFLPVATIL